MPESPDFSALIGSRICHDLVNPIGAIGNGVELMLMDGAAQGPELALIAESVANASARIRFFRIAFGASGDQRVARSEVLSILSDLTQGGRLRIDWTSATDMARGEARLAFLAIQCCETVMPYGGTLTVTQSGAGWEITGQSGRFRMDEALWARLTRTGPQTDISPAHVQFALLPLGVADLGRHLTTERTETDLKLRF
jgi:histidine phosphotransferase ChpT